MDTGSGSKEIRPAAFFFSKEIKRKLGQNLFFSKKNKDPSKNTDLQP